MSTLRQKPDVLRIFDVMLGRSRITSAASLRTVATRLKSAVCIALICAAPTLSQQKPRFVTHDNSDWFSIGPETTDIDLSAPRTHTQHRELAASNLEIASVEVGLDEIARAASKFGRTTVVGRGDAAYSRNQACYVSNDSHAYLIFEEDGEGFGGASYLFSRGRKWNGSEFCSKLPLNSARIQTTSGLRLGLSQHQVEAILGKPSKASPNALTYTFAVEKKTSSGELDITSFVVAKFATSKLVYLAVSQYESLP
jgi:hypothetical protein